MNKIVVGQEPIANTHRVGDIYLHPVITGREDYYILSSFPDNRVGLICLSDGKIWNSGIKSMGHLTEVEFDKLTGAGTWVKFKGVLTLIT